jgi:hypothetical protein
MSPPHSFRERTHLHVNHVEAASCTAMTESEPLAPIAGAAAFLIARGRSLFPPRAHFKEPIEKQANRHL